MKVWISIFATLIMGVITASPSYAKVTSEEARGVIDYYFNGKGGGAVFLEADVCRSIAKEGPNKNNCEQELDQNHFPVNNEIVAWTSFLVPQGDKDTIYIEFMNMGMVWKVVPLTVKGALRYRTWAKYTLDKLGVWTISVKHVDEANQKSEILQKFEVTVK